MRSLAMSSPNWALRHFPVIEMRKAAGAVTSHLGKSDPNGRKCLLDDERGSQLQYSLSWHTED
jgi:hypothetical protein